MTARWPHFPALGMLRHQTAFVLARYRPGACWALSIKQASMHTFPACCWVCPRSSWILGTVHAENEEDCQVASLPRPRPGHALT